MTEKTQEETQQEQVEAVAEQVQEVLAAADEKQPEAVGEQGDPLIPVDATKVAAVDLHPFEVLQGARLALNASLGYIHGAGGTIGAADTKVKQLEAELATAQGECVARTLGGSQPSTGDAPRLRQDSGSD